MLQRSYFVTYRQTNFDDVHNAAAKYHDYANRNVAVATKLLLADCIMIPLWRFLELESTTRGVQLSDQSLELGQDVCNFGTASVVLGQIR